MTRLLVLLAVCTALALPARAEPILIELFASQNCAACPRAHQTMAEVDAARDDVLILTWSVDYWDYLGEADPLAMPLSSERQAAYAEHFRLRGPYTPQTVYNGVKQCPGNRPDDVAAAIEQVGAVDPMGVMLSHEGARWRISVPTSLDAEVHLVQFRGAADHAATPIHAVTGMETLGRLERGGTLASDITCRSGCALIVQAPGHGEVYAAQRVQ